MQTERLTFPGDSGAILSGRLDLPQGAVRATALFAHCFTCSKDIPAARRISGRLAALGIAVLRFDFTGLGHSEGEFAHTDFTSNVGDLAAAARYLAGRDMTPGLLIGHSLGGAAVLKAAGGIDSVRAVVTLGAPFDPAHVTENFAGDLDRIAQQGEADVTLGGRPFRIRQQFVDDVSAAALEPALHDLRRALLVLHAPRDAMVGIDNATRIFQAARHPKSFVSLDNADHLISDPDDAEYAAGIIAAWAAHYLDLQPDVARSVPEGIVRVTESHPGGFVQDISVGPHALIADEPTDVGGSDRGPSPYGLLSAALGACTSMTLRMYARRKGWDVAGIGVDVTHEKSHAADANSASEMRIDVFDRAITLEGDLTADQRDRLLEIADKCPVHKTLERTSTIRTRLV